MSHDSDIAEAGRAMRAASQSKREQNRLHSPAMLTAAGIPFESRNGGAHLIVAGRYDFWPGTGLWMARGDKAKRRGVRKLIARIQAQENDRAVD